MISRGAPLDTNAIFEVELAKRGVAFERDGKNVYRLQFGEVADYPGKGRRPREIEVGEVYGISRNRRLFWLSPWRRGRLG